MGTENTPDVAGVALGSIEGRIIDDTVGSTKGDKVGNKTTSVAGGNVPSSLPEATSALSVRVNMLEYVVVGFKMPFLSDTVSTIEDNVLFSANFQIVELPVGNAASLFFSISIGAVLFLVKGDSPVNVLVSSIDSGSVPDNEDTVLFSLNTINVPFSSTVNGVVISVEGETVPFSGNSKVVNSFAGTFLVMLFSVVV